MLVHDLWGNVSDFPMTDEQFIRRCFDLALNGIGSVSPNPLVGCVIAHNGNIIGEGWHKKYGGPHAEVNAVASVADQSLLSSATVYVNLEPCSHFGKTPPCADLLIEKRVKKVVISNADSNELVSGKGARKLRDAGIEVVTGVLEAEGRYLNRRFFTYVEKKRPYIILKWAQTSDGFISRNSHEWFKISNSLSHKLVHRWRSEEDAFLVGTQTAATDNPKLNVREWVGRDPLRVVIDRTLRLDASLNLFDGSAPTICYNLSKNEERKNLSFVKVPEDNFCHNISRDLFTRKIQSLVVEGGAETLNLFISQDLWDEARVFQSEISFGDGLKAPSLPGVPVSTTGIGTDVLSVYQNFSVIPEPLK
ncbi:MAG TPA: bifunctional diaminohydroxyphosphoribosylaminopyrimidine deaminase/5-amino-6-(5-phosphoribosylamino)uracil reductase RibD [Cyclobacteriaceae bacterium]|nr:bifunctional diaminohydroxyphosphoribosylaminopyrimidine deaminase/5-amino-6-(5-phosphoribosylamino)uracil reductase RibD [Cyclobacteriaceae bacterium]